MADPTSLDAELIVTWANRRSYRRCSFKAVSAGFEQLTGYMREEAVGESPRMLGF